MLRVFTCFFCMGLGLLQACGLPRTVAIVNRARFDCADPVTITVAGTSTSAAIRSAASLEIEGDTAEVIIESACTFDGEPGPARCSFDFGNDGTQSVFITNGSGDGDVSVRCNRETSEEEE